VGAALGYRHTDDPFASVPVARRALRIGLCSSLSWGFLRDLIRCVRAEPDASTLSFLEATPHGVLQAARRGQVDVGFVYGAHNWARLEYEDLWREPLMVLMPDHHPLAGDSEVSALALRKETFLVAGDPAECELQRALLQQAIGGIGPPILAVPVERATMFDLVSLGVGLALTTGSALGAFHPGVTYRPIAAPSPPVAFHAVWRLSNRNEDLSRFLDTARAHAA
jgi:DNA-binding transcriptional LysR family regulator